MRSTQKELLDEEGVPVGALHRNLYELNVINRLLGGYATTIKGLKLLLKIIPNHTKPITIVDIGSGGGDTLKFIAQWALKNKIAVNLIGIDLKQDAIDYACLNCAAYKNIFFIQANYKSLPSLNLKADVYINALFCHHLSNEEIIELFVFMNKNAALGFVINDLQRNLIAYYGIKIFSKVFSKSYLVKNDAPLSVLRAFHRKEIGTLAILANVPIKIEWVWAFRWLVTSVK